MSYDYQAERPKIFTEEGVEGLLQVLQTVERALKLAGAVRMQDALAGTSADMWASMAIVDYLVERGELREIVQPASTPAPHRLFVSGSE